MWKKAVVACFNVIVDCLPTRAEKHENPVRVFGLRFQNRSRHFSDTKQKWNFNFTVYLRHKAQVMQKSR